LNISGSMESISRAIAIGLVCAADITFLFVFIRPDTPPVNVYFFPDEWTRQDLHKTLPKGVTISFFLFSPFRPLRIFPSALREGEGRHHSFVLRSLIPDPCVPPQPQALYGLIVIPRPFVVALFFLPLSVCFFRLKPLGPSSLK